MAVKNFKWQAHLVCTEIIRLEVLDYLHDFPTNTNIFTPWLVDGF